MQALKNYFLPAVIFFTIQLNSLNAQVVINEFSASNLSQYVDNHSDYNDWIELYNTTGSSVNIGGYYLSDDSLNNTKWKFPSGTSITANGFMRIWASGRDEVAAGSYHTNFTIKQTKNKPEWVILSDASGVRVDMIKITKKTQLGHSYGRTTDGASTWSIFKTPTPKTSNINTAYLGYADKPDFDLVAGFYSGTQTLTMSTTEVGATIYYTTDGKLPTAASAVYTAPIAISATQVVKAITISSNSLILPSFVEFDTYFINVSHTVPVISIAGNNMDILANGDKTQKPYGSFEYFNVNKQRTAHTYGGYSSHGQDSWANSHRSLDFVSRDEMGYDHSIEEVLFNTSPRDNYQKIIMRAAGDDNYPADHHPDNAGSAHVRDAFVHNLVLHGGLHLDVRRGSKCVVYLNGQYWGVYDLRDNPDYHDNTNYYYGQDKFHLHYIETWGNTWAQYGGQPALDEWFALRTYILNSDLTVPANYKYVTDRLDVTSLTDYVLTNMFTVCSDWLNWNTAWWRGTDSTGTHLKWGYALWDNDATFGHYINYTSIPDTTAGADPCDPEGIDGTNDPEDHIGILMKLRTNPDFNQYYISRQLDLGNTVFSCANMLHELDSTVAVIDPEMSMQAARWGGTYSEWQDNVQKMRNFIIQRCSLLNQGWIDCYNLNGPYDLTLLTNPAGAGSVQVNSLTISQFPWTGSYFGGVDTKLNVLPNSNYTFNNWSANSQTFSPGSSALAVKVNLSGSDTIVAHFSPLAVPELSPGSQPVISAFPTVTSSAVTLQYSLPEASAVSIRLYSMLGSELAVINSPESTISAGNHMADINLAASKLPAGMYMLNFVAGKYSKTIKLIYSPR